MKAKELTGLILGIGGFVLAIALPLEGLGLSGQLTLGIFTLAAVFWIFEPIPIFATSMVVILLQTLLLSSEGLLFSVAGAPKTELVAESFEGATAYRLPATAVNVDERVRPVEGSKLLTPLSVEVLSRQESAVVVASPELSEGTMVLSDAGHRSASGEAVPYSKFYGALSSPIIMLFLGGFALAAAAVKFGLDQNLTRILLKPFGSKPANVCLGLMICTGTLSAFMSNTATTAMMMTVVLPIVGSLKVSDPFRKAAALSIPLAANIGGIATPIGTPPNAVALAALKQNGINIGFSTWMLMAAPFAIILLLIAWKLLMILFKPEAERCEIVLTSKGKLSTRGMVAYIVFGLTVLLWVTEKIHGLSTAMIAFIPIAMLPALGVLEKKDIRGFSWEVLWLVAGGISLGLSMKDTGLAEWMISRIEWSSFGTVGVLVVFGIVGYALSNLISNTVTATMLMPLAITVGAGLAATGSFHLVASIVAITVIVSCAMVLPISTPPNAIAMSAGILESKDMAKVGLLVGVIGGILSIACGLLIWPMF